jgi:uncharacterized circularly permuted ATP-grasp superfamily protein
MVKEKEHKLPFDEMSLDGVQRNFKDAQFSRAHYQQFSQWLSGQGDQYLQGRREEADFQLRNGVAWKLVCAKG